MSRTLNVTYLRPAPMGCKILVTSEVVQAGRTVCTIRGWITQKMEDGREGKVLAIAEHGKIGIDPPVAKL